MSKGNESSLDGVFSAVLVHGAIAERIAGALPRNDVACTLKLVNKALASQLQDQVTVRLSEPSPSDVFARRWGSKDATRSLTFDQRQQLLCLTATSGSIENLKLALTYMQCLPTSKVLAAAAAAGHLHICKFLREQGCSWNEQVLEAAVRAGHLAVAQWLKTEGCPASEGLLSIAAKSSHQAVCEWLVCQGYSWGTAELAALGQGGHVGLLEDLLPTYSTEGKPDKVLGPVLQAVAEGCDLGTLVWLHRLWLEGDDDGDEPADGAQSQGQQAGAQLPVVAGPGQHPGQPQARQASAPVLSDRVSALVVAAAAGSCTPDWQAKVEWLLARGFKKQDSACSRAAAAPDALDRLEWLQKLEFRIYASDVLRAAMAAGNSEVGPYLRAKKLTPSRIGDERIPLDRLKELNAAGDKFDPPCTLKEAVRTGNVEMATWVMDEMNMADGKALPALTAEMSAIAAASGKLQMLEWLVGRGCPLDAETFRSAACAGSEEQLQWLAARRCPMADDGEAYIEAARNGDFSTLQCLKRLRCPLGSSKTFTGAVSWGSDLSVLAWLLNAGCSVDWPTAVDAAQLRQRPPGVVEWLLEQRQERQREKKRRCVVQ